MTTPQRPSFLVIPVLVGVLAVGAGAWLLLRGGDAAQAAAPAKVERPADTLRPPVPVPMSAPDRGKMSDDPLKRVLPMVYPDGSQLPPLNGVKTPPPIDWPKHIPFAPVIGKEIDGQGIEWYKHADGSRSTVQMVWRKDLGRMDATAFVNNPAPVVPMADETGKVPASARKN